MRFSFVIFLMLCAINASSQDDSTGAIRGFVYDKSTGETMPGCAVFIVNSTQSSQTDVNGFFQFGHLEPGEYAVGAFMPGYSRDTVRKAVVGINNYTQLSIWLTELEHDSVIIYSDPPPRVVEIKPVAITPSGFNRKRCALVLGTEAVLITGSLIGLDQLWYKQYPRTSFHTFDDNLEWMQMDKIGHVQTAYSTGLISAHLLYWTGMKYKKATWIGGLTGFTYLTAIEIMDGFSEGWGFSIGDMAANTAGSALFISQQLIWQEQRIQLKFGFRRSGYADYRPELLGSGYQEELLKDYNGQTYWLSVNVASFLKDETRFPQWLNVAFGYGANGMTGGHENPVMYNSAGNEITLQRYRQYYLSLDIDLRKLPVKSAFLKWVFTFVSFIKIPAPGIELSKNGVRPIFQ